MLFVEIIQAHIPGQWFWRCKERKLDLRNSLKVYGAKCEDPLKIKNDFQISNLSNRVDCGATH